MFIYETGGRQTTGQGQAEAQETEKIWHGSLDPQKVLQLHGCITGCNTAWCGNCSASDRKALQRVMRMAQYITGAKISAIQDLQYIIIVIVILLCYFLFYFLLVFIS